MKIAILGGAGFIGSHLAKRFSASGDDVRIGLAPDRRPQARIEGGSITLSTLDDYHALVDGTDLVIHAAGRSTPATSRANPMLEVDENLRSTLLLSQALVGRTATRLIYLSSAGTVYGDVPEGDAEETRLPRPLSSYGAGKVAAEAFLHALWASHGIRVGILRATNVYGPGQKPKAGFALIPWAIAAQRDGTPFEVRGGGLSRRDFLYIDDFGDAVERLARLPAAPGFEVMNVGSGVTHSVNDVLDLVERLGEKRIARRLTPDMPGDVARIAVSIQRAKRVLDWKPETTLGHGIEATMRWMDAQAEGGSSAFDVPG
ncbi:NAD-dependent epimerase/dehydratase family protein [Silanimonas sp.]|uniref:NAD-dependent epimerase/dehydratase family protein n=1 Tax=Silanimonas sp. TaxID=1929290 RepID=UPI0022BCC964|nr:NAD-dependent epimerase/dehydratase family protein [Silanimonas sp.]MCZ8164291.1 NAD-dependent epimerase/dehydratase family protein [Silanimonas sp.]